MSILNEVSVVWWPWVFHAAWQSAAVGLLLVATVSLLPRLPSPVRHGLLVVALLKFAVPPVIGVSVAVPVAPAVEPAAPVAEAVVAAPMPGAPMPTAPMAAAPAMADAAESPFGAVRAPEPGAGGLSVGTAAPAEGVPARAAAAAGHFRLRAVSWRSWLLVGHALGAVGVVALLIVGLFRLWVATRVCRVDRGAVRARFDELGSRLGLRGGVDLLVSPADLSPMALGVFRRRVVVPESLLRTLKPGQVDAVLAHELAHHRRRDTWWILVENVLLALWWFHPVYWLVLRALRGAREDCCDDLLLESGIADDDAYCESLLRAAAAVRRPRPALAGLGLADDFHPLGRRLRRIMDVSIRRRRGLSAGAVAALLLLALLVAPGIRVVAADQAEPAAAAAEPAAAAAEPAAAAAEPAAAVTPERLKEGLIAHYPFDGDAADHGIGGESDGTVLGATLTADRHGHPDSAYHFNGKNQSVAVPHDSLIDIRGKTPFTLGVWLRAEDVAGERAILWKWGPGYREDDHYRLGLLDGRPLFGLSRLADSVTGPAVPANVWLSVVGVYRPADERLQLYVNGALVQEKPCAAEIGSADIPLYIGAGDNPKQYFAGDIDEVRIYNRALSMEEIAAVYGGEPLPAVSSEPVQAAPAGHVEAWSFPMSGTVVFDGSYGHGGRGQDHQVVRLNDDGTVVAVAEMPFMGSKEIAAGSAAQGLTYYEISGESYKIVMEFEPGKVFVTRRGVREDWDRKVFDVPAGAVFEPNARPDSYCAVQVYFRTVAPEEGQTAEFQGYDWDNSGNGLAFYTSSLTNAGVETVDTPAGKFMATHLVLQQLTSADTWFKKRAGHVTDFWVLSDGTIVRILRHREPYELQLLSAAVPAPLPERVGPPSAPEPPAPAPSGPTAEAIKQILAEPAHDLIANAPGDVTLNALYRHKGRGRVVDVPEHRWVKTMAETNTVTAVSSLPFMQSVYLAAGSLQQGFARYEVHRAAQEGGNRYDLVMEFEPGRVIVTRSGVRENWDRKVFEIPAGAVFDPNTRPDPYCALQVLERVITVPGGESLEFDAYDWDNSGDGLAFYKMKITNAGYEEVTVPCGRFKATHVVLEQLTSADTWFKKRAGHKTDIWLLADGTILRVLRHREPYEMELLDWSTPETLPGLEERTAPQPATAPDGVERVAVAESDRVEGCWSPRGFTVPYDAAVYLKPVQGEAGGVTELGIGPSDDCMVVFRQLPNSPEPSGEVKLGDFKKGDLISFCMKTVYGQEFTVSTSEDSDAAKGAFQDVDGSLGLGAGSIAEQIAADSWLIHFDDANSYQYDDDDNDIPIIMRLEKP